MEHCIDNGNFSDLLAYLFGKGQFAKILEGYSVNEINAVYDHIVSTVINKINGILWCGAYWQSKGLTVIPTISWSTPSSYDFCFDGVEENSIVAVGMIGCKQNCF